MNDTAELLDRTKEAIGIQSDYALANRLGVVRQRISQIRTGRATAIKNNTALKIAQLLKCEPGFVMATIAAEHEPDPEIKAAWQRTAQLLRPDRRKTPGESPTGTERRAR